VIQAVTSLAKKQYNQWKTSCAIERKVHAEITNVAESIERLSFDAAFTHEIFRLAAGETVDAGTLVALGTAVTRDGKPIVSEAELIAALKDFAYKLVNAWQGISPKAGDVPTAFTIFRDKIDALATGETFAKKMEESAEAVAIRLVESQQRAFQQHEQAYQNQIRALTEAVTALHSNGCTRTPYQALMTLSPNWRRENQRQQMPSFKWWWHARHLTFKKLPRPSVTSEH
jgi:hypothetical protein